jgi:hypothetical protein
MTREEKKNEDEAVKEPLLKENSETEQNYDIEDDLENFVVKVHNKDSDSVNHSLLGCKKSEKQKQEFIQTNHHRVCNLKNSLNIISLILLFFTCLIPVLIFLIQKDNISLFYDYFKTHTLHLQINFEIFLTIWIVIIITLFVSILRHSFNFTSDVNEIFTISKIIFTRLNHYYYIANFVSVANLINLYFNKEISHSYGIFAVLSLISSLFYFLVYLEIKKEKFSFKYFLNYLSFNVGISFILAWANYLLGTSLCIILEIFEIITEVNSELIGFIIQGIICLVSIVIIVYYKDPFYVVFLVMYQLGLALVSDDHKSSYENDLNILFTIFTGICLLFGVFLMKRGKEEEERENVLENYNIERKRSEIL